MKKHPISIFAFILVLGMLSVFVFLQADNAGADITRYVKVSGTGDGTSWATASGTLQAMIDNTGTPCQIWVASGTYYPTTIIQPGTPRTAAFQMRNNVGIYGGFPNSGSPVWDNRDCEIHKTILSGDIGILGDSSDNSYNVIFNSHYLDLTSTAVLDGFTITGGNAVGGGGGMCNILASPTVTNCTFTNNSATAQGGGIYNISEYMMTINNCTFVNNSAEDGGAIYNYSYDTTIDRCAFTSNSATGGGGAIYMELGSYSTILTNCTFFNNSAGEYGGAIYEFNPHDSSVTNCTFFDNSASSGGGIVYVKCKGEYTLTNSIFWGNSGTEIASIASQNIYVSYCNVQMDTGTYPGIGNINADPQWVNPGSGDFHLQSTSTCIDAGTNTAPNLPAQDFEGDIRIIDGNANGTPTVDMGVDEYGVKVGIYVNLQGDERPFPSGWEVPINTGFYPANSGTLVMNGSSSAVFWFEGTTSGTVTESGTRAYFECPQSVAPGTYDITADTISTLLNVKRLVGIW